MLCSVLTSCTCRACEGRGERLSQRPKLPPPPYPNLQVAVWQHPLHRILRRLHLLCGICAWRARRGATCRGAACFAGAVARGHRSCACSARCGRCGGGSSGVGRELCSRRGCTCSCLHRRRHDTAAAKAHRACARWRRGVRGSSASWRPPPVDDGRATRGRGCGRRSHQHCRGGCCGCRRASARRRNGFGHELGRAPSVVARPRCCSCNVPAARLCHCLASPPHRARAPAPCSRCRSCRTSSRSVCPFVAKEGSYRLKD